MEEIRYPKRLSCPVQQLVSKNVSICYSKADIIVKVLKKISGWAIARSRTRSVYRQYAYFNLMMMMMKTNGESDQCKQKTVDQEPAE